MYLIYGRTRSNALRAARLYRETYPARRHPNANVFRRLDRRVRESGHFVPRANADRGRPRTRRTPNLEENIIALVEENPRVSTRNIALELEVDRHIVWNVINDENLHPFHYVRVQSLLPMDFNVRVNFCTWLIQQFDADPTILRRILWTDEANFNRNGVFNIHNEHFYARENPHVTVEHYHQQRFSVNVWAGIIGDHILGPIFINGNLNGENFLNLLNTQISDLLDDLPLGVINNMYFQLDGAPVHNAAAVRTWLNERYFNHWIGRGGPIPYPPRSPDITPLDFFLWGYVKNVVYSRPVDTRDVLIERIRQAFTNINRNVLLQVRNNIIRRAQTCLQVQGQNFEHLL